EREQMEDALIISKFADERTREEAFGDLLKKYQQKIYWHVRRMVIDHDDADDVVQDIFIKVWRNLEKFREDSQLYTWLYRIATNKCRACRWTTTALLIWQKRWQTEVILMVTRHR